MYYMLYCRWFCVEQFQVVDSEYIDLILHILSKYLASAFIQSIAKYIAFLVICIAYTCLYRFSFIIMHFGMIVGIGPGAADFYNRYLINAFSKTGLDLELTMVHADTKTLLYNQSNGNIKEQLDIYMKLTNRLKAAGAESIAITSIAGHFCIKEFIAVSPLPVINMIDVLNTEILKQNYKRLGLLGTRGVMESQFYGSLDTVEVVAPDTVTEVHNAYIKMATEGVCTEEQRNVFITAGKKLVGNSHVEAVMLAGTDLNLAFDNHDPGFPVLNCAEIHAAAIVLRIMQ